MRQMDETKLCEGREALARLEQEGQDCTRARQELAKLETLLSVQATAHEQLCIPVVAGTAPSSRDECLETRHRKSQMGVHNLRPYEL